MKRVLIIAYFYPPNGSAGTQRPAKFAKYLPTCGWEPLVLTPFNAPGSIDDPSLLEDIDPDARIWRVNPVDAPTRWARQLPAIDIARNWLEPAYKEVETIVNNHNVDMVFITMSPFDLTFLGTRIRERLGVPVVLDLRDPWALDGWRVYRNRKQWEDDRNIMERSLTAVDGVVMNTPEARVALHAAFPRLPESRTIAIPNGYDAADLQHTQLPRDAPDDQTFCLVHTGTLHTRAVDRYKGPIGWLRRSRHFRVEPIDVSGRTEIHLFDALKQLRRERHPLMQRLNVVFVGKQGDENQIRAKRAGLTDIVRYTGYLPHRQSVAWLHRADALFLPLHGLPAGHRSRIVPGKTYEYLASNRPILGCLPQGDARDLIARTSRGFLVSPCDSQRIADALRNIHTACRHTQSMSNGGLANHAPSARSTTPIPSWVMQYERRNLTACLATFFECIRRDRDAPFSTPQIARLPIPMESEAAL